MSKLLVVFGATGQQGASVITQVLEDAELSKQYTIRGLTRDSSSSKSQSLVSKGVEMVQCDADSPSSLQAALSGAHTVFVMTVTMYVPGGIEKETVQGKAIADEVVKSGAKFLIYSSLPSPKAVSGGKYPVDSFDNKKLVQDYISSLPIDSAFFWPGTFMQNFHTGMAPRPGPDGNLVFWGFVTPETVFPLIDIAADTGKYVATILAAPEQYRGKSLACATRTYTMTEVAEIMARSTGKPVTYKQIPKDVFGGFLGEESRETLLNMLSYFEEFGYYGKDTAALVRDMASAARGKLTEFEEYLTRESLKA
ncbi:NAD(P)-binding protein [Thozetella sp. PMI_491]|nr:NAD(P)-binding protein [Thozetella sp. PMI_491]